MTRRFVEAADLTGFLRAHRPDRRIAHLRRMTDGTTKGVYRITYDDDTTQILYCWTDAENYWPEGPDPVGAPFRQGGGAGDFKACHAELVAAGIRVPAVHVLDQSQQHYPADLALLEDFPGDSLNELLERDAPGADRALRQFGELLRTMHDRARSLAR